tara:strand:- start:208 stop:327 length:120 start_codon:yes stop_codon:yes gene_type:complete
MLRTIFEGVTFVTALTMIYIGFIFLAAGNDSLWFSWVSQ